MGRVTRLVIVLLVAAIATGAVIVLARAADARDAQRVKDVQEIRRQVTASGTAVPTELPATAPRPQDSKHSYQYRALGNTFVACTTFERADSRNAFFVTATGEFRAEKKYCDQLIDPRVATIVTDAKLTDAAIPTFLGASPELADAATVKDKCQVGGKGEALYGCYLPENKIWVLDVTDPELAGLSTVAAVHELLHALETTDPPPAATLDQEAARLNDPVLNDELSLYSSAERTAELGARLGTEYGSLDQGLEAYYGKYFDRGALLARYQAYGKLVRQVSQLQIQLDLQKRELDELKAAGRLDEYNARVDSYNMLVRRYNAVAARYNLVGQ